MKPSITIIKISLCIALVLSSSSQVIAQTSDYRISADWQALGWTLPKNFSPEQIPLFKGLNAARGTWAFEAKAGVGKNAAELKGRLVVAGGAQGGMASAWKLIWFWPAENPQHAIEENILAMPEGSQKFGWMLVRLGPLKYSEGQRQAKPKSSPLIFKGHWNAEKQTIRWRQSALPKLTAKQATSQEDAPAAVFEMVVDSSGRIAIQNSEKLPVGQIWTGGALTRIGDAPEEPDEPKYLAGLHEFQEGSQISDPRIMRYLPVASTDIKLISDRNGHMAHYRMTAEAFDDFLADVWEGYHKERAARPDSWVEYSKQEIVEARKGVPTGRYDPRVRSTEISFDKPLVWEPLENATRYEGPRKTSAAGATYYFDRENGIAFHDAGYW